MQVAGKCKKGALNACIWKLQVILNGMVKSGQYRKPDTIAHRLQRRLLYAAALLQSLLIIRQMRRLSANLCQK